MFYYNQFLHNLSNQFFLNLLLIRLKRIEANYLYVYQTNFILKISHINWFLHFIVIWNLVIQKGKWQPKKVKWYKGMIKSVTQHSYFEKKPITYMGRLQNNPSIGWVHPKSTHARPLAWGNKHLTRIINVSHFAILSRFTCGRIWIHILLILQWPSQHSHN
jgi:hypothetical protein